MTQGVGKMSKGAQQLEQRRLGFPVISVFFFPPFLHVLTAFALGGEHSPRKKSLSHTHTTDNPFSSCQAHSVADILVGSILPCAPDINTSHQ